MSKNVIKLRPCNNHSKHTFGFNWLTWLNIYIHKLAKPQTLNGYVVCFLLVDCVRSLKPSNLHGLTYVVLSYNYYIYL